MQQYFVDQWIKIEDQRLMFIRNNQKNLKADTYKGVMDAIARGDSDVGD